MPANDPNGQRFGEVAEAYDRGRPGYPTEVVDWLLSGSPRRVLDLGAGTGKLTESLVGRCEEVVAVEPSEGMRAVLGRKLPTVTVLTGSAETIPLPDHCVDAVVVAQAWHWVDPAPASVEVARVLATGGTLGLVWNDRDEADPWIAGLSALLEEYGTNPDSEHEPVVLAPFGPWEEFVVPWTNRLSADDVVDMILSRSYVIALTDASRADLVRRLREHLVEAAVDGQGRVAIPYVARAFRARRAHEWPG